MKLMDSRTEFGLVTRWTHVVVLVLIGLQLILGWSMGALPEHSTALGLVLATHESFGLLLLAVAVFFVLWAVVINKRPEHSGIRGWQRKLSLWVHGILFALILLEPLLGLSVVELGGHAASFFGIWHVPAVFARHRDIAGPLADVHSFIAGSILVVAGLHALAALYHHFVERDDVLVGMLPWRR